MNTIAAVEIARANLGEPETAQRLLLAVDQACASSV